MDRRWLRQAALHGLRGPSSGENLAGGTRIRLREAGRYGCGIRGRHGPAAAGVVFRDAWRTVRSVARQDGVEGLAAVHHEVEVRLGQVAEVVVEHEGERDVVGMALLAGAWPLRARQASSPMVASRR